jgi:curved DNA-binding protein CbpA
MTHYETLEISPNASAEMVKAAWKTLGPRYHPDNRDTGDAARFRQCNDAYETLRDPQRRAAYNLSIQNQRPSEVPPRTRKETQWRNGSGWVEVEVPEYPGAGYPTAYGTPYGGDAAEFGFDDRDLMITEEMAFNLAATIGEAALQSLLKTLPLELRTVIQRMLSERRKAATR